MQIVPRDYRGRYSYWQEQRTPDTPNLACVQVGCQVPSSAWGIYLGNNPKEEAAMRGLPGVKRLIACPPGEYT